MGLVLEKVDGRTFKYIGEKFLIAWNYTKRLQTGQTITSATVTVEDSSGNDVTSQIVDTASLQIQGGVLVRILLKKDGGIRGNFYYVLFMATATGGDQLGQLLELEVR